MAGVYRQPQFRVQRQPSFIPSIPPKISGTATTAQAAQSDSVSGKLIFSGSETASQAAQVSSASGKEKFSGSCATAQSQTDSVTAKLNFRGTDATAQSSQAESISGKLIFSGSAASSQSQVSLGSEKEIFVGSAATSQSQQSSSATGTASGGQQQQQSVGRLSHRRKLSGGAVPVLRGELPKPPIPAIRGFGLSYQQNPNSSARASIGFAGRSETAQSRQESVGNGDMFDTEMETMLAILMEVA